MLIPELEIIKFENAEIKIILELTNKRIDDISTYLIDQSRRIDETIKRIDCLDKMIVRKEEHEKIELRVVRLEQDITKLKKEIYKIVA